MGLRDLRPRRLALRDRALAGLEQLRLFDLLLAGRRALPRRELVVLNYHRVLDEETLLDEGVISATSAAFAAQVLQVARFATPVTISQVCAAVAGAAPLPDNPVLITFDDGYRDNHDLALPLLRRHGVPATFFVTTGYIQAGRLPWWDRISYVVRRSAQATLTLGYPRALQLDLSGPPQRAQSKRALLRLVKQEVGLDLPRFLAELSQAAAVEVDEAELARGLFMDWEQVAALQAAGMDIGAHTHSHRVLQTLTLAEAREELVAPRAELAQRLGRAPRAIAYPVGRPLAPESGLPALVREAGYEIGFTFVPGAIQLDRGGLDALNLPRFGVERGDAVAAARFKGALALPRLLV